MCRGRIFEELGKTKPGRRRLEGYEEGTNWHLAEEVEAADFIQRAEAAPSAGARKPSEVMHSPSLAGPNVMLHRPAAAR